ncbi:sporulation histidine kinase inhibitor Sda [Bacillaceae bacterium SAS-127]|nr:sporulation histidine kinase inhibitor Sda [Bacillaceae bacterium SAS-127]
MKHIPDDLLLESYFKARQLKLNKEFLDLMEIELKKRSLLKNEKIS